MWKPTKGPLHATVLKGVVMARATKAKKDALDGAQYWSKDKTPKDYMTGADGKRPGETKPPNGEMTSDLSYGSIQGVSLPPRSIWKEGKYLDGNWTKQSDKEYRTWVISGEGTPGNYLIRRYVLPSEIATDPNPDHPTDWPKGPGKGSATAKKTTTSAPSLPVGIRFRCPGCGHWYRESDLAGHAKVCPGQEGGSADWAIACECCDSLDDTAKCKQGFPRKKPEAPAEKKEVEDGGGAPAA